MRDEIRRSGSDHIRGGGADAQPCRGHRPRLITSGELSGGQATQIVEGSHGTQQAEPERDPEPGPQRDPEPDRRLRVCLQARHRATGAPDRQARGPADRSHHRHEVSQEEPEEDSQEDAKKTHKKTAKKTTERHERRPGLTSFMDDNNQYNAAARRARVRRLEGSDPPGTRGRDRQRRYRATQAARRPLRRTEQRARARRWRKLVLTPSS